MNRQYIDFVPAKSRPIRQEIKKPIIHTVKVAYTEDVITRKVSAPSATKPITAKFVTTKTTVGDFLKEPTALSENFFDSIPASELGVVEDYTPTKGAKNTFKTANVEKRPLSTPRRFVSKRAMQDVAAAKAEKVSKKQLNVSKKSAQKTTTKTKEVEDFKTPFVNRNVEKRPLSKTVYPKKQAVAAYEEPSAPVTIINKPEKDSRISIVITILLTIILGAAVGTVAFLLLPR